MTEQINAEQVMKLIENMDNGERIKLLKMLSEKHFGRKPTLEEIQKLNYGAMYEDDTEEWV
jgi:hypothetical protein